ncbi:DNA primase [Methylomarinum sp. Ch1-1]|uniref:DNA primase n=1 Tax=Methylomarinum roseum TaxID=3067653 RepID=A0AAU7NWV2_9GAMM|nr:DNA primase [Methylomarinum sp. Ch1-1]MDP4522467.1 DNA primase [Methylomarinum sp. Ch1-1]
MSGSIPREFINDLLVRVDIVDLIDSHVPLKKSGSNFVARCPFHNEKTPSFSVSRKKQLYHCFGCGVGGDAISFLMDYNHLDFVEAVEDLASFVGVEVPREAISHKGGSDKQELSDVYHLLEQVAAFYREQLRATSEGREAVNYLKGRGVSGELARDFALGYAPKRWDALLSRFDRKQLMAAGLLASNDAGKVYDRFRGRLMFPIRDRRQRIIGFGGRVMDDSVPKYLNSPETAVFSKGREVYGLAELLAKDSKPSRILVVEGYMDVIALAQFGIGYAVAALGTATSQAHMDLLFRFSSELVFCFDGDNAGRQAAWRAVESAFPCLRDGRQVRIMLLPQGHDPDTLVRAEGVDGFVARVDGAQALSDYFFDHLSQSVDLGAMEGRAQLLTAAKPYLEKLPTGFFKEMMFARLRELSGSPGLDVSSNLATLNGNAGSGKRREGLRLSPLRVLIALLVQNPDLVEILEERNLDWDMLSFPGIDFLRDIFQIITVKRPENAAILLELYRGTAQEKTVRALANLELSIPDEEAEFKGALERLVVQARESGLEQLLAKERREGLTTQEKEVLRKLLSNKL